MTLTNNERLMLTCLFSLMKGQRLMMDKAGVEEPKGEEDIPSAEQCHRAIEILRGGYELLYDDPQIQRTLGVLEAVSREDGRFVVGVFHMFEDIGGYMEKHPDDADVRDHEFSKFRGFDARHDPQCYRFACFLTETLGRHSDLLRKRREEDPEDPLNSHCYITRAVYEAMLKEWRKHTPLQSREQILAILKAGGFPPDGK